MQRKTLMVVRHGQSKAQTREEIGLDSDLSSVGEEQALALSEVLASIRFDHIRVSPLIRARRTFELSGVHTDDAAFDTRILESRLEDTVEYDFTPLLPYSTPPSARPDTHAAWGIDPITRLRGLVAEIKRFSGDRILLVGHCGVFHILRCFLLSGEDPGVNYHSFVEEDLLRNSGIGTFSLDTRAARHELLDWNATPHLDRRPVEVYLTR